MVVRILLMLTAAILLVLPPLAAEDKTAAPATPAAPAAVPAPATPEIKPPEEVPPQVKAVTFEAKDYPNDTGDSLGVAWEPLDDKEPLGSNVLMLTKTYLDLLVKKYNVNRAAPEKAKKYWLKHLENYLKEYYSETWSTLLPAFDEAMNEDRTNRIFGPEAIVRHKNVMAEVMAEVVTGDLGYYCLAIKTDRSLTPKYVTIKADTSLAWDDTKANGFDEANKQKHFYQIKLLGLYPLADFTTTEEAKAWARKKLEEKGLMDRFTSEEKVAKVDEYLQGEKGQAWAKEKLGDPLKDLKEDDQQEKIDKLCKTDEAKAWARGELGDALVKVAPEDQAKKIEAYLEKESSQAWATRKVVKKRTFSVALVHFKGAPPASEATWEKVPAEAWRWQQPRPQDNWFHWSKLFGLILIAIFTAILLYYIDRVRKHPDIFLRKINGLDAVDEAIGRATEMGKPIMFVHGLTGMSDVATIAAINILERIAGRAATYDTTLKVTNCDPIVLSVSQEVVKEAYNKAGRPDSYREENVYFVSDQQFAYVTAIEGQMVREKPAANFFLGYFFAESLLLSETGSMTGAIQIAGTDSFTQLPFFVVTCDYTLIGEELYAASAYLSREPKLFGSIKGVDMAKLFLMIMIVLGAVLASISTLLSLHGEKLRSLYNLFTPY